MAEMDIVPYIGTRTPADFDTLFDELEAARGSSASLSDAIAEKADKATTLSGYGIADAYTKTETDTALLGKQGTLSQAQLAAANSGITAEKLAADEAALDWNVNQGVKNLIKLNPDTYTSGNVVAKLNDDGTVSVSLSSGSTANTTFSRAIKTIIDLRDMDLILNGCPSGGNYSRGYALYISDDGTTKEKDEGNGVLVPKNTTVTTSYLALIVRSGTAISETLTFKPMMRPAYITDSTFRPYALPNPTLTADITSLKHTVDPRSQSQVSGGDLDNVAVSEMRIYSSPSGLPTGVSASSVCIVETLVVDSNSAYQVITLLTNQGTVQNRSYPTYKRVKVDGVWYDWKLIVS